MIAPSKEGPTGPPACVGRLCGFADQELHHGTGQILDRNMLPVGMDFDLGHEFLLCSRLCQTGLDYNLNCKLLSSLTVSQFVALSKTSLSKELSFDVFLLNDLSVTLNFLNNGLRKVR